MSAVLVLKEMPKTCKECRCQLMLVCVPADEDIDEYVYPNEAKPDWCPLRPLPTRPDIIPVKNEKDYVFGWNDCLKEITGETE